MISNGVTNLQPHNFPHASYVLCVSIRVTFFFALGTQVGNTYLQEIAQVGKFAAETASEMSVRINCAKGNAVL